MMVVGLSGGIGQGKTTVGRLLREAAGSSPKADLEFSYPITEVVNAWMALWPKPLNPNTEAVELANELIMMLLPVLREKTGKEVKKEQLLIERTEESMAKNIKLLNYLKAWRTAGDVLAERFPVPITPETKHFHRDLYQWLGAATVTQVDRRIWGDVIGRRIDTLVGRGEPLITIGGVRFDSDATVIHERKGLVLRVVRPGTENQQDTTEVARDAWKPDVEIINNAGIEELEAVVRQLWHDMQAGWVQPLYTAQAV